MTLVMLQIVALTLLNAGLVALFELMGPKQKRLRFFLMAVFCFGASSLIFYLTASALPIWRNPFK